MSEKNEIERKKEIKRELISKDLTKYLKLFIPTILICIIFGYIGYVYSKDNNEDLKSGIIFGTIYPIGIMILKLYKELTGAYWRYFPYIIYTIFWICIVDSIPLWLGISILLGILIFFIGYFIFIETKKRNNEVNKIYLQEINSKKTTTEEIEKNKTKNNNTKKYKYIENTKGAFDSSGVYISPSELHLMGKDGMISKEEHIVEEHDEYECERCYKKISYEEWELYDMMCEECFMDVHTDDKGNYHDEEIF